jgi:hypothetical protein
MYPEHRLRIIAYLVDIGKQLNELPEDDLSLVDQGRLLHRMELRDSLMSSLNDRRGTSSCGGTCEVEQ